MNTPAFARKTRACMAALLLLLTLPLLTQASIAEQAGTDFRQLIEDSVVPIMAQSSGFAVSEADFSAICAIVEESGRQVALDGSAPHSKDGLLRALLSHEFGGTLGEWRVEDQAWYADLCVSLGLIESSELRVPQEGEISQQMAITIATQYLLDTFDVPDIDDLSAWCCTSQYVADTTWRARWIIEWSTVDPQDSISYQVELSPYGEIDELSLSPDMFRTTSAVPDTAGLKARLSETRIAREDAIELAWSAVEAEYGLGDTDRAQYEVSCSLTASGNRLFFKIAFWRSEADLYSIRVDAQTGNILDVYDAGDGVG